MNTTETEFLADVAGHEMSILREDGVDRHVRFAIPGSSVYRFDLITWPGVLCYTGDMGTFVFSRTRDMFEFFRTDRKHQELRGRQLVINLGYWSEKLIAVNGSRDGGKAKEFDDDKFRKVINEYRVKWMRGAHRQGTLDKEERRSLWESVDEEVLRPLEDGGDRGIYAAYDFCHRKPGRDHRGPTWQFDDLFEHDFTEYTHTFVWCCYALAYGIQKYDEAKAAVATSTSQESGSGPLKEAA
jgi:hypothetical protein